MLMMARERRDEMTRNAGQSQLAAEARRAARPARTAMPGTAARGPVARLVMAAVRIGSAGNGTVIGAR